MELKRQYLRDSLGSVSRRNLLKGATILAATRPGPALEDDDGHGRRGTVHAYVGTYTPNGQGIYLFQVNVATGALTPIKVFPSTVNPSWIAFDPTKKFLYAANEISNFNGGATGSVTAYSV